MVKTIPAMPTTPKKTGKEQGNTQEASKGQNQDVLTGKILHQLTT